MSPQLYFPMYYGVMVGMATIMGFSRTTSSDYRMQETGSTWLWPLVLCIGLAIWIGLRPVSFAFGDTVNYAFTYKLIQPYQVHMDWSGEWVWRWLMVGCKSIGMSINGFFTIVSFGYILTAFFAARRLMPSDPMLGMIFILTSLMFFSFGVNGLRNGLACHIILLAIAYLLEAKWVPGVLLCLLAFGIHRSTMLPIAMVLVALFLLKDVRIAIIIWGLSIVISIVAGGAATSFFVSLGFDDRMSSYANDYAHLSKTGFRWDFLLYSAVPVVYSWYICLWKKVSDNWFNVLSITYCLCNAFWVLVIRSSFSNRFAYLSWFLYPIVMAYPLVNLPVWEDQDRKTGYILLAYAAFTAFMWFVFWA